MSADTVWHAQNGLWRRLGNNPITPGSVSGKPLIGVAIAGNNETNWEALETQVGTLAISRSYAASGVFPATFAASTAGNDVGKRESVWSFKPTPSDFAAGTNDVWFNGFLDSIPAGHKTKIILWHEPEGQVRSGTFTLADWKAANNHMGAMVHAKNRPELQPAICVIGAWEFTPSNPLFGQDFWDAGFATNIDYIGFDPYVQNGDFTPLQNNTYFMQAMDWASSHDKPVLLTEYGASADPGGDPTKKADWIEGVYQFGITANLYALLYFDQDNDPGGTTRLITAQDFNAIAAINADSKVS